MIFLDKHNILSDTQFGFRQRRSTTQALSEFTTKTLAASLNKLSTLAVYLDLSKAFETLHFSTLFQKLNHYGIRGVALQLIKSYLCNRKMYVAVNNVNSELLEMNQYVVPQGSVLGPPSFYYLREWHVQWP